MEQNGRESVSTVILADEEASLDLFLEATMHVAAGWKVEMHGHTPDLDDVEPCPNCGDTDCPAAVIRAALEQPPWSGVEHVIAVSPNGKTVRRLWMRDYDPMAEEVSDGE